MEITFHECPHCNRMVGVRNGNIDMHYVKGGAVLPLLTTPEETLLSKGKVRCAFSGKPYNQSALSAHERDIINRNLC